MISLTHKLLPIDMTDIFYAGDEILRHFLAPITLHYKCLSWHLLTVYNLISTAAKLIVHELKTFDSLI